MLEIPSFYTCVPKTAIIYEVRFLRYRVRQTEKWKKHLEMSSFYTGVPKITIYASWDIDCDRHKFLSFWAIFCPSPSYQPKKSKFWKHQKKPGYIIILHECTTNDNYMMYGSGVMEWDRIFCHFELFFCPFIPLTTQKIKILKKMKKILGDTIILQMCIINQSHMMYGSCNIRHDGQSFRHFGPFFAL